MTTKVLYGDNAAAIQLSQLDAGAWRTRHLRLRGVVLRQAVDELEWRVAHLSGVFMPADIGTKVLGPARFADLMMLLDLRVDPDNGPSEGSQENPQIAQALVMKVLLAVIIASTVQPAEAGAVEEVKTTAKEMGWLILMSLCVGFGFFLGIAAGKRLLAWCSPRARQVKKSSRGPCRPDPLNLNAQEPKRTERGLSDPLLTSPQSQVELYQPTYEDLTAAFSNASAEQAASSLSLQQCQVGPVYQPTYEDLEAAYPYAFADHAASSSSQQRDQESLIQEYAERCTHLRNSLQELMQENDDLHQQLAGRVEAQGNQEQAPERPRFNHRQLRDAYRQVQEFVERGEVQARDPTAAQPELVGRYADDEIWVVQVPRGNQNGQESDEDSFLDRATTSSGEYTIRERSSDSSGGYAPDNRLRRSPNSSTSTGAVPASSSAAIVGLLTVATSVSEVDGGKMLEDSRELQEISHLVECSEWWAGWFWGLIIGGIFSLTCFLMSKCVWHFGLKESGQPSIHITNMISPYQSAEKDKERRSPLASQSSSGGDLPEVHHLPQLPRKIGRRKRKIYFFLAERGECVHTSAGCSTLRGTNPQARPVCQQCAGKELHVQ